MSKHSNDVNGNKMHIESSELEKERDMKYVEESERKRWKERKSANRHFAITSELIKYSYINMEYVTT